MQTTLNIAVVTLAYFLGSISTAVITCKIMGLPDPRRQGSENPGATNVLKIGGKKAAAITLAGDFLKGFIPVFAGVMLGMDESTLALVATAAFMGHLYPIFFAFRGGKGVATAFGAVVALSWPVAIAVLLTWLSVVYLFRLSSLGALVTALLAPVYVYFIDGSAIYTLTIGLISALLILRHKSNIEKILDGTED